MYRDIFPLFAEKYCEFFIYDVFFGVFLDLIKRSNHDKPVISTLKEFFFCLF